MPIGGGGRYGGVRCIYDLTAMISGLAWIDTAAH